MHVQELQRSKYLSVDLTNNQLNDYSNIANDNHQENDIHLKFCNQTVINKERQQNLIAMSTFLYKLQCFNLIRQREKYMFDLQIWIENNFYLFSKQACKHAHNKQSASN